jgi:hypothetical protein
MVLRTLFKFILKCYNITLIGSIKRSNRSFVLRDDFSALPFGFSARFFFLEFSSRIIHYVRCAETFLRDLRAECNCKFRAATSLIYSAAIAHARRRQSISPTHYMVFFFFFSFSLHFIFILFPPSSPSYDRKCTAGEVRSKIFSRLTY